jgi:hypothetical protein
MGIVPQSVLPTKQPGIKEVKTRGEVKKDGKMFAVKKNRKIFSVKTRSHIACEKFYL